MVKEFIEQHFLSGFRLFVVYLLVVLIILLLGYKPYKGYYFDVFVFILLIASFILSFVLFNSLCYHFSINYKVFFALLLISLLLNLYVMGFDVFLVNKIYGSFYLFSLFFSLTFLSLVLTVLLYDIRRFFSSMSVVGLVSLSSTICVSCSFSILGAVLSSLPFVVPFLNFLQTPWFYLLSVFVVYMVACKDKGISFKSFYLTK